MNNLRDVPLPRVRGAPEFQVVYLENQSQMLALKVELIEAQKVRAAPENCWGPRRTVVNNEKPTQVEPARFQTLFDSSEKFNFILEPTCDSTLEAETVIAATGQRVKAGFLLEEIFD